MKERWTLLAVLTMTLIVIFAIGLYRNPPMPANPAPVSPTKQEESAPTSAEPESAVNNRLKALGFAPADQTHSLTVVDDPSATN